MSATNYRTFSKVIRVPLEMGVVIAKTLGRIELINGDAPSLAEKQTNDSSIVDRSNFGVARSQYVDGLVVPPTARVVKLTRQLFRRYTDNGHRQITTFASIGRCRPHRGSHVVRGASRSACHDDAR